MPKKSDDAGSGKPSKVKSEFPVALQDLSVRKPTHKSLRWVSAFKVVGKPAKKEKVSNG